MNAENKFVVAVHQSFKGIIDPALAEICSIKEILSWLKEEGLNHITVESDSQLAINALKSRRKFNSYFGAMVKECLVILEGFERWSCRWISRSVNSVAHLLERSSNCLSDRVEYLYNAPFISNLL